MTSKKLTSTLPDKYVTIAIDQTRKAVGCDLYRAWFPSGERVSLPYWKTYEGVKLLGALTETGETFVTEVAESFTSEVTIRFLRALQAEFGEHLHLILDNATYFSSNRVIEFVEETAIRVTYLPTGSPDMNPVEECWRQFKRRLGNRYFDSIEELRPAIQPALDAITPPNIYDYICPSVRIPD
jgi:transposase